MKCKKCILLYNTTSRKPLIGPCGHTYCQFCIKKQLKCPNCLQIYDKAKFNINDLIYELLQQKPQNQHIDQFIKVSFLGYSSVGKTSMIKSLRGEQFNPNTIATVGMDYFTTVRTIDHYNVRFQIWDTAGQQKFRAFAVSHLKNANIVVIVYDVNQMSGQNKKQILEFEFMINQHCSQKVRKILVGNKIDMQTQMNKQEDVLHLEDKTACHHRVSCKANLGIQQLWSMIEYNSLVVMGKVINYVDPSKKQVNMEKTIKTSKHELQIKNNQVNKQANMVQMQKIKYNEQKQQLNPKVNIQQQEIVRPNDKKQKILNKQVIKQEPIKLTKENISNNKEAGGGGCSC